MRSSESTAATTLRGARSRLGAHVRAPLFLNSYALILSAAGTAVLGLVYWTAAARAYPAKEVGVQSVIISTTLFLAGLSQLSLNSALIRFLPVSGGRAGRLIGLSYGVSALAAVGTATLFVIGTPVWSSKLTFLRDDPLWFASFVLATAVWCVFSLQDSALTGLRRAPWVPVENVAVSVVKVGLLLLFQRWLVHSGVFASWMLPAALAVAAVNVLVYRSLRRVRASGTDRNGPEIVEHHPLRSVARFAGGNYIGFVFYAASSNLLPLIVLNRRGAADAAYFFLPWAITSALLLVAASTTTSLTVETVRDLGKLRPFTQRTLAHTFLLITPAVALLVLAGPTLLGVFGQGYAAHGGNALRLLALGVLPNAVLLIGLGVLRIRGHVARLAAYQVFAAVVLLGMSWVLLPRYGITSIGVAFVVSQTLASAVLVVVELRAIVGIRTKTIP